MNIGDRIKRLRETKGISQTELAKKVHSSKQTIYKYENGIVSNIPSDKIEAIAAILETTPSYLMGWEDNGRSEVYCEAEVEGIHGMTSILKFIYDQVDVQDKSMDHTFYVVLKKAAEKTVLNEDEYHLLFDFVCSNIPNYLHLIKGKDGSNANIIPLNHEKQNLPDAAHERTDIRVTDEMRKHDDDIMNDDEFWK